MDEQKAIQMYTNAVAWLGEDFEVPVYDFDALNATEFLEHYCWCVFNARFPSATLEKHFDAIADAYHGFDIDAIAKMDAIDVDSLPIKDARKANWFLKGAKAVAAEGFDEFKERLHADGMDMLERELPGIGSTLKKHMAKVIGLEDVAKDDVWLTRCAKACSTSVDALCWFLADKFNEPIHHVDTILFEYCKENQKIPATETE